MPGDSHLRRDGGPRRACDCREAYRSRTPARHRLRSRAALLLSLAATIPQNARAEVTSVPPGSTLTLATIDSAVQFDFRSALNGESYRIQVFVPYGAPPAGGYPVLYVLDGNALFGTVANAVRNRSQAGEISPAVVVGIASGSGSDAADRTLDFTSSDMTDHEKLVIKDIGPNAPYGGSDRFLRVIEEEVGPHVQRITPVDRARSIIFGWSLGGLFVVHTMLTHPHAFSAYAALSPSLWRGNRAVFRELPSFKRELSSGSVPPRLFLGVSSLEGDPRSKPISGWTQEDWANEIRYVRMKSNVVDLAARLRHVLEPQSMALRVFAGETHNSVPWTAINPVLDFTLQPPGGALPASHRLGRRPGN